MSKEQYKIWLNVFDNDVVALEPEMWANESLMILEDKTVALNRCYRDFSDEVGYYGKVVNAHRPASFNAKRKGDNDEVVTQNASVANIPVPLNQQIHVSFLIPDGQESRSMKDLIETFLYPAMNANAQFVDAALLGQVYKFRSNAVSKLGTAVGKAQVLALRSKMTRQGVPLDDMRDVFITPDTEASMLLNIDEFTKANEVGDDGTALREAYIGRKYGFNWFTSNHVPSIVSTDAETTSGAVNNVGGYAAGVTTLTVEGFTGALVTGAFVTIAGDDVPHQITGHTETAEDTTQIVVSPALSSAVANDAVITYYVPGAIDFADGYVKDYAKALTIDGITKVPQTSQMVVINGKTYAVMNDGSLSTTSMLLDLPPQAAMSNSDVVAFGPAGQFNLAVNRNAIGFVSRPLALPRTAGPLAANVEANGLSVRVVITYDGKAQGHRVTVDLLFGIAILDERLGAVLYA